MGGDPFTSSPPPPPRRSPNSSAPTLRFLGQPIADPYHDLLLDLDERDVLWADDDASGSPSSVDEYPSSPPRRRRRGRRERSGLSAALDGEVYRMSAPVDVPAWSAAGRGGAAEEDDEADEGEMVPPHVVVARRWRGEAAATFSVFEGAGRTLKGRDLRTVRNAVLRKTGFLD